MYTEAIARWPWAQQQFGQLVQDGPLGSDQPTNCQPGAVWDDPQGTRWLCAANGTWVSMQGTGMGELVQAGPLGNDSSGGYTPLGHLLDEGTSDARNEQAEQLWIGSRDPFLAALQGP
jgi:hypothetical protein